MLLFLSSCSQLLVVSGITILTTTRLLLKLLLFLVLLLFIRLTNGNTTLSPLRKVKPCQLLELLNLGRGYGVVGRERETDGS